MNRILLSLLSLLCVLFAPIQASAATADGKLSFSFAKITSALGEPDFYSQLNEIYPLLLNDDMFELQAKLVPAGLRGMAGLAMGGIDLTLVGVNPRTMNDFPYQLIDIYPLPLITLDRRYYALKSKHFPVEVTKNIGRYRLGITPLPAKILELLFQQKVGSYFFFNSHLKLGKALAGGRIDLMVSGKQVAGRAFRALDIADKVEDLGSAFTLDLHLLVRKSMPAEKKQLLFQVLSERIPELQEQKAFEAIFSKTVAY